MDKSSFNISCKPRDSRAPLRGAPLPLLGVIFLLASCQTPDTGLPAGVEMETTLGPTALRDESPAPEEARPPAPEEPDEPHISAIWPGSAGMLALSLEDAVFLALRNNRELAVQELSPIIAGTFVELERSLFDPRVFAEGSYFRDRGVLISPNLGDQAFDLTTEGSFLGAGIVQDFATGTSVEAGVRHEWSATDFTPDQHQVRAGVTVTQSLLQGRGREANLARIRQARIDERISEYELRGFTEALVSQVETTYWNYSLARQQLEIFESSLEVARRQLGETQQRVDAGTVARTELAASRAEEARRRQDLIGARARFDQTRIQLLRLMNPASREQWETPVTVAPAEDLAILPLDPVADHVVLGLRMRPELGEARLRVDRGELEVVRTRDGLLPRLELFASLGKSGFAQSFSDSARGIDGNAFDASVGLRLDYPLGNRGARASHRAATVGHHQTALALENLSQLIEVDIRTAYLEVLRAQEQITATAVTRELQEEVLEAEEARFDAGVSTALLVAQAQRDLLGAQLDEVQAVVDYRQALTDLYRLEGSLLLRRGIAASDEM
ncbi:MAG: TolC family protein [Luteolibacter sp.]